MRNEREGRKGGIEFEFECLDKTTDEVPVERNSVLALVLTFT